MKAYQDNDPLHGYGKAIPKPKQPTRHTYRGNAFGHPVELDALSFRSARDDNRKKPKVAKSKGMAMLSPIALIAACLGFNRGR